jgi:hypothetical protein
MMSIISIKYIGLTRLYVGTYLVENVMECVEGHVGSKPARRVCFGSCQLLSV